MDQRKKFYVALLIYAALGLLIWVTMDNIPMPIGAFVPINSHGKPEWFSELFLVRITWRQFALAIVALFAVRTVLHWHAEKIRAERDTQEVSS
jgi:uncharacterized membrane protein YagU involved in acid resistance